MRRSTLVVSVWLVLAPGAATAELYKCQAPDGKTLFTSDRSQCPGAAAHEPSGSVQRSESTAPLQAPAPLRPVSPPPAAKRSVDDEAEAATWRAKRKTAEDALEQTEARLAMLHQVSGWCHRGQEVWAEDADGLRRDVDCDEVARTERELRSEEKRLRAYLAEGLEDECRRAGCLPGWIR